MGRRGLAPVLPSGANNRRQPHGYNRPIGAPILWISEVVLKQYVPMFVKHIIGKVNRSGGTGWDPRTGTVIKCLLELYSLSRSDDVVGNFTFELSDSATIRGQVLRPDVVFAATATQNGSSRPS